MSDPALTSGPAVEEPKSWEEPAEVDLVKELNAHAGRLATLLGLLVAATTFSLGAGPVRDVVFSGIPLKWPESSVLLYLAVDVLGLAGGASVLTSALHPSIPIQTADREQWRTLIQIKQLAGTKAAFLILNSIFGLMGAWAAAVLSQLYPANPIPATVLLVVWVLFSVLSVWTLVLPGVLPRVYRRTRRWSQPNG